MGIKAITEWVGQSLPASAVNDLPMIRQALNDAVDGAVRDRAMTERQANNWNQDHAVRAVRKMLRQKAGAL